MNGINYAREDVQPGLGVGNGLPLAARIVTAIISSPGLTADPDAFRRSAASAMAARVGLNEGSSAAIYSIPARQAALRQLLPGDDALAVT